MSRERRTFRLDYPHGFDRLDRLDWSSLQRRGVVRTWFDRDQVIHLGFAEPYESLDLVDGETLTMAKAAELRAALAFFGEPLPGRHGA